MEFQATLDSSQLRCFDWNIERRNEIVRKCDEALQNLPILTLCCEEGECPIAEEYYTRCLAHLMYPSLTNEKQQYVIETIIEFYIQKS